MEYGAQARLVSDELDIPPTNFKTYGLYGIDEKTPDFTKWLEEIHKVYNELRKEYEIVHIGGLSLGASLSLAYDICYPNNVNGCIIALAPILKLDGWGIPFYAGILIPLFCKLNLMQDYLFQESEPYGLKNKQMRAIAKKQFEAGDQSIRVEIMFPFVILMKHIGLASMFGRILRKFNRLHLLFIRLKMKQPVFIAHAFWLNE